MNETQWPADEVSRWPIEKLIPSARNARLHSDEQVAQLAASMREWGWTIPVLVDEDGNLIAGHGRLLAARQLGYNEAPTMVARGWSEAKKRAYMLADNKLTLNASWDDALLTVEMKGLQEMGFDLSLTGFSDSEIAFIVDGWETDFVPHERDGENLEGLKVRVTVLVEPAQEEAAKEAIDAALTDADIEHELQ
ncbi:ParB/Srx family N-terminal domain-containing protein [Paraburkholderia sp. BR10923]|uniref:ParB/Srx family N-terminal domain-containing protein n=1 Tax=Paraburkholderia sp. BR10923 TaxID=3236992 RepID=UPI0034CE8B65